MPNPAAKSIFQEYYQPQTLVDRYAADPSNAVDVLIPVIHTNELWEANLHSIFREIPVKRLLISDGGCIDNSIEIVKKFPRVTILDHRAYTSLGFCIRKLIEAVETEWFVYVHSDVYLPPGWFDVMLKHQGQYDWFECDQHLTVLADYRMDYTNYHRPLSGSQMGKKTVFRDVLPKIDDDYLYRNEDIIIADLVERAGGRYGRVDQTFHYHQMMHKDSAWKRKIKRVNFEIEKSPEEEQREFTMQVRGLIKYTEPNRYLVEGVHAGLAMLEKMGTLDWNELRAWTKQTNPQWLPHLRPATFKQRLGRRLAQIYQRLFGA